LFVDLPFSEKAEVVEQAVRKGVERYRREYARYFERYAGSSGMPMRDPNPRVVLVPGVGLIPSGKDRRACRIVRDLYMHTLRVIRAASGVERYAALPDPGDEPFLEAALAGAAECLITGNLKDFPASARKGLAVLSPREFLDRYQKQRPARAKKHR
jgi:hypothetical protein